MADRLSATDDDARSNLTPNTFLDLYEAWRSAKRQLGESSSEVMHIKKKMKGAGVNTRAFDMMCKLNDLDADEAATVLKSVMRYATWCGMPFATQGDLTRGMAIEKPSEDAKAKHDAARAQDDGYFAGRDGTKRAGNPHKGGSEPHVKWDVGWLEGQASIAHRMKDNATDGTTQTAKPRGRPPGRKTGAPASGSADDKADDPAAAPAAKGSGSVH